jgi:hypothetical protein
MDFFNDLAAPAAGLTNDGYVAQDYRNAAMPRCRDAAMNVVIDRQENGLCSVFLVNNCLYT